MNGERKSRCFIGLHADDILKEIPLTDLKDKTVGLVIVNRCVNCGRIKGTRVKTVDPTYN